MQYHVTEDQPAGVDEVSRRRRATYRRRFTTVFGGASGVDGATASAAGEMTAWEDDEMDDDDENFLRERARCRLERLQMQQKKTRKKAPRRYASVSPSDQRFIILFSFSIVYFVTIGLPVIVFTMMSMQT